MAGPFSAGIRKLRKPGAWREACRWARAVFGRCTPIMPAATVLVVFLHQIWMLAAHFPGLFSSGQYCWIGCSSPLSLIQLRVYQGLSLNRHGRRQSDGGWASGPAFIFPLGLIGKTAFVHWHNR